MEQMRNKLVTVWLTYNITQTHRQSFKICEIILILEALETKIKKDEVLYKLYSNNGVT